MGRAGESRAEADAGRDAGNKYVREIEIFCQNPGARCNGEKLATIESRETRVLRIMGDDTETTQRRHREARKWVERNPIIITAHSGARGYSRIRAGDGTHS